MPSQTRILQQRQSSHAAPTARRVLTSLFIRIFTLLVILASGIALAQVAGPLPIVGTGGTITTSGSYRVHTFTGSGTFVPPVGVTSVEVLVVAGGGGGGSGSTLGHGGGGGAGGVIAQTVAVTPGASAAVTVGGGGTGGTAGARGGSGSNSVFVGNTTVTATGGGGGGGGNSGVAGGLAGGSGGGGGSETGANTAGAGGTGTVGEGNAGGAGRSAANANETRRAGGGGGGAGGAGAASPSNGTAGAGGAGTTNATFSVTVGGGGGGSSTTSGAGGTGGGGAGVNSGTPNAGTVNTGGGGGGNGNGTGGAGGSGIVILRYLVPTAAITTQASTTATLGAAFGTQPVVRVVNGAGAGVSGVSVTASLNSGGGTLGGTLSVNTDGTGYATFTNLSISGTTGVHTLAFTTAGLVGGPLVSNNIDVQSPALAMSQQPSTSVERGAVFAQQPIILASNGSPVAGVLVTASIQSGGGTLGGTVTATTNGSGLATFTGLSISGEPGDRVLRFSATGWSPVDSNTITVTASTLAITQQASTTPIDGVAFVQQPIVRAVDGGGTPISGVSVTAAIASGPGTLGGTVTQVTDGSGYATFTNLLINGTGAHTLSFSATGWNQVVSNTITVQASAQTLAISQQPSASVALGVAFAQQPIILANNGSPVAGVLVTAAIASGPGTLGGTVTATTNGSGLATFTNLSIGGASGAHTLTFTATGWGAVVSNAITVQPSTLTITQQPDPSVRSAEQFSPQPIVRALDGAGNPVSGVQVTAAIQTGAGTLGGTLTATTDGSGFATFTNLAITGALGDRTLRFTASGWNSVDSNTVTVVASPLTVSVQPSTSVESGVALAQQPVIQALDGGGNPISGLLVTASIFSGGGTLGGTLTATTDGSGLATFTNLSITGAPGARVLRFSATDWTAVDSNAVTVFSNLTITQQPSAAATSGFAFAQQPIIQALDGNSAPVSGLVVTAAIATGGGTLGGTVTATTNGSGLATFTNLSITGTAGDRTLEFTASGWGTVTSNAITISAAPGACLIEGGIVGSQLVELMGCTTAQITTASTSVPLDVPPGTTTDDLLIAVLSSAGNGTTVTAPVGWTEISDVNSGGGGGSQTLAIYTRIAGGSEPSSYTFTTSNSVVTYAFMMRYDGASGVVLEGVEATGNSTNATAPTLTTTLGDTLIVRLAAVRGGMTADPVTVITGHRNITQGEAGVSDGAGAYFNQVTAGTAATASFTNTSSRWVAQTIGIEPAPIPHFEISHAASHGTCNATTPITVTVRDNFGAVVTNYTGTMTLTSSGATGNFALNTGAGTFDNLTSNDGVAQYTFVAGDNGQVILNFSTSTAGTITFNAVNGDTGTQNYALSMVVGACAFRISHDAAADVCAPEAVTVSVVDSSGNLVNFVGSVSLSAAGVTGGNWTKTSVAADAYGALDNGAAGDSAATYGFLATDGGTALLNYQAAAGTANFNVVAAGIAAPSSPYDADLVITTCTFRVTHSGTTDVCSITAVTLTLVSSGGTTITNYTGTVNLSTTTGFGTWSVSGTQNGTLNDGVAADGNATYEFVSADAGTVTLNFLHASDSGTVNINVSDGTTLDPRNFANTYDQNITVAVCTFEISHSGDVTACEVEAVTVTVRNSTGGVAVAYTGTMTLGSSTNHGNWLLNTGSGVLTDTAGDDNGVATYAFADSDNGVVVLNFADPHAENVSLDAVDGDILVNGSFDPSLYVTSCLPAVIGTAACVVGSSTSLTIPAQSAVVTQRGRMVLMSIAAASGAGPVVSSASFNSQPMTLIRRETTASGEGSVTEMWGILEANLPTAAGSYTGSYVGGAAGSAMCLLAVDEVKQEIPVAASPTASTGPLNGVTGTASTTATTTITTTANNALVVMATNMDGTTFNNARGFSSPIPTSFMVRQWGQSPTPVANPTGSQSRFAGAAGRHPTAGIVTMTETLSVNSPVYSQVVASFEPLIAGSPLATDYEPVTLFKTYSGSLSYRAVGNTLRTTYNEDAPTPLACNFVATGTGSSATLTLPVGATVTAAYLYWAGSGDDTLGHVDDTVSFGITGSETAITAPPSQIFLIDNVGNANDKDYFAAYRDVTTLVTGSGSYTLKNLQVQNGTPWSDTQSCAGGWAVIVLYEHADERLRVINLFHGFQPFQNSSFTLVPRNFRMAARDAANYLPNGQITHITIEGDETINAVNENEGLGIQDAPDSTTFTAITSSLNPLGQEFNATITRPVYGFDALTGYYEFNSTGGVNSDGYEIDFPGPDVSGSGPRKGNSWGLDVDTHYIQGAGASDVLYPFGVPGAEAEQITTRYSAEGDLVMLISEVISITNFPLADIEVTKTEVGTFKVNSPGTYQIEVTNNGNGAVSGGYADGEIKVADILPAGMTFANASDVSGTGWTCSVTLSPGAFTCTYDIGTTWTGGAINYQLAAGESLPLITANVQIGGSAYFPLLNNNAKNSVRVLHSDGGCPAAADGIIPDPTICLRSPQFDNFNDLEGGNLDINDLDDKTVNNNNVDSVTTVVKGVQTNLSINKFVNGILEEGTTGSYTLRVTNNGPDATTATITVTDTEPTGVDFDTQATGTGWSCSAPSNSLTCTYAGSLANGASTDITVPLTVTGSGGFTVTNTASVAVGAYNFDIVAGNNSDTDITQITAAPVASQERFLMSVSSLNGLTTIGGLSNFEDDDYIIYDPVSDTASMYFDNSALGYNVNDADAVHLMKNGHIVISAADAGSTVGSNNLAFEPGDLVVYDPILQTARMLFDGSTIFAGAGNPADVNITAAYVIGECELNPTPYNCSIIIAATPAAGGSTLGGVAFTSSDLIQYNLDTGVASLFFDGTTYFDEEVDVSINGFYLRVNQTDANANINTLVMSVNDSGDDTITLAATAGWDPVTGTYFTRDDVTQINIPGQATENLFLGDVELGIFTPADATRRIDALHVIEDGYMGHFAITEVVVGDACTPKQIRISKHEGLTHTLDSDYFGSIQLTTSTGLGNWAISSGSGSLTNGTLNDGIATYTFVPGDAGDVVLTLSHTEAVGVGVNVSNRIASEAAAHDPSLSFDAVLTAITYRDEFTNAAFNNNQGSLYWSSAWAETDAGGLGVATGNVRVLSGEARFTVTGSALARGVDFNAIPDSEDILLTFNFRHEGLSGADAMVVEARESDSASWTTVSTLTGLSGAGTGSRNLNLSTLLYNANLPTATAQIRFRISNGYAAPGTYMFIDNVEVSTATDQCGYTGVVDLDHYSISHSGAGISCLATDITISGHDVGHGLVEPNETILLTTSTAKGTWASVVSGTGTLSGAATLTGGADNGNASYEFPAGETDVTLRFNHTVSGVVSINVTGQTSGHTEDVTHDADLTIAAAGLRFYNETLSSGSILTQIAGKNSNVAPNSNTLTIQAVRTSNLNPSQCEPIFSAGETLTIGFAAECKDPGSCAAAQTFQINGQNVSLVNDNGGAGASGYTEVSIPITTQPSTAPAGTIVLNYSDVGQMELHAQYDIPFNNDPAETYLSGDYLTGTSSMFIVRPFGFDIDFSDGRQTNGSGDVSYAADQNGSAFKIAGEAFDTSVTAVRWQSGDDANNDGVPDAGANLTDNGATPNFDQDSTASAYKVRLSVIENKVDVAYPAFGVPGVLGTPNFDSFVSGVQTHSMTYDEVGVVDLRADIVDNSDVVTTYKGTSTVEGKVLNVGRFYPNLFAVSAAALTPRADASCSPASTFTYMDEEFGVAMTLTARNIAGATTQNYHGVYAKLDTLAELGLVAYQDRAALADVNLTTRLENAVTGGLPATFAANWASGVLSLNGRMLFARAAAPDGPYASTEIGTLPNDNDNVSIDPGRYQLTATGVLNMNLDNGSNEATGYTHYRLGAAHEFRYGRMIVNNAYGPETEDLALTFDVEYYNGSAFVRNSLDNCSLINAAELSFNTYTAPLQAGDTIIAAGTTTVYAGQTQGVSVSDDPLETSAPGEGNTGIVNLELDLSAATGLDMEYLQFEWDDAGADYNENPQGQIEFGQYRMHDRIINWQEIYNTATP